MKMIPTTKVQYRLVDIPLVGVYRNKRIIKKTETRNLKRRANPRKIKRRIR